MSGQIARRNRFEIMVQVKVYEYAESASNSPKGNFIFEGISWNISFTGICIFTNNKYISENDICILEFSLSPTYMFSIPSKLIRKVKNKIHNSYAYECGFQFDFTGKQQLQDKLMAELFKFRSV